MRARRSMKKHTRRIHTKLNSKGIVTGALLLALGVYSLLFFIPKPIDFAYAGDTCMKQLVLFPSLQKKQGAEGYDITSTNEVTVADVPVLSTGLCVTPTKSPEAGSQVASIAPFGGPLFAKKISITAPEAPVVSVKSLEGSKISAGKALDVAITEPDVIHEYSVVAQDTKARCTSSKSMLSCDIPALKLEHGKPYTLAINRVFPGNVTAETIGKVSIATLDPMLVAQSPLQEAQVVYTVPTEFAFEANRDIDNVKATLSIVKEGVEQAPQKLTSKVEGKKFTLALSTPLERKANYVLRLVELNGTDGGTLAGETKYAFSTSGGPKVSGVSAGASGVGQSERIVLTFDQPVDEGVQLGKFIRTSGVASAVSRISETQVAVTLQNAALCSAFSVVVDKGMKSGSNGEVADEAWKFDSRVVCGVSSFIGYSVRGRPIIAHYFGNGPTTILFTAGIHGSEPSSTTTMQAWVEYLKANAHKLPADKRVVVVPNTNPDGIASGSRNNVNNVNLGRNFPTANWKADIETASGLLTNGGGTSAGSEPEAAALIKLTRQLRPRLEVSFHAQGSLVGANKFGDSVGIGDTYAKLVGFKTMYYDAEAVMGYPMTGEYEDWMGEELGIPAILIELPRTSGNYLTPQLNALLRMTTI